ncbi:nucleoporin protein Ndc1-Nup, partial [Geopyxis carbonaria]
LAFRELRYIANSRPDRRRDIFIDVNRQPKNAWEQILQECLQTLREVESRLSELSPFRLAQSLDAPQQSPLTELDFPPPIPIGKANILVSTSNAKSHKFLDSLQSNLSENALRSRKQLPNSRNWINPEGTFLSQAKFRLVPYIASSYGKPFRQTIQLTASRILPNVGLQIDAVEALTYLVCASLTEDEYGVVHKDLSTILEHFNSSLHTLENFCNQPPLHWTDTDAKNAENSLHLEEPNHLIETLRSSKNKILQKFEPYKD